MSTGRNVYRRNNFVIKEYKNCREGAYEYEVLTKILNANPITFLVPKIFKIVRNLNNTFLIMEYINGRHVENCVMDFLLYKDQEAFRILNVFGRAIRELHNLKLNGLYNSFFPTSPSEIKIKITNLSKRLAILGVLDHEFVTMTLDVVNEADISHKIFSNVDLHGELYFTHMLMSSKKPTLLDFHNSCKGPSYYDLATLSVSLYISLLLSFHSSKQLLPLIDAFLLGYFGRGYEDKLRKSVKIAELYLALKEILVEVRNLYSDCSVSIKLISKFKIQRLKTAIKNVIVPKIFT